MHAGVSNGEVCGKADTGTSFDRENSMRPKGICASNRFQHSGSSGSRS